MSSPSTALPPFPPFPPCRLLKKLRRKDNHQIALERREQGFSLYLNGANTTRYGPLQARHPLPPPPPPLPPPTQQPPVTGARNRASKTAGEPTHLLSAPPTPGGSSSGKCRHRQTQSHGKFFSLPSESRVCVTESEEVGEGEPRAKTAPSKRKGWSHNPIEVKSEGGVSLFIKAPSTCACTSSLANIGTELQRTHHIRCNGSLTIPTTELCSHIPRLPSFLWPLNEAGKPGNEAKSFASWLSRW